MLESMGEAKIRTPTPPQPWTRLDTVSNIGYN